MSVFRHVLILHSNPPTHEPKFVKYFLKSEKVTVLPQPPYSPDLATCDFFFFFVVVSGRDYKSRQVLARPSFSASAVNLNQRPVKHFRNGFKDWNHEYQTAEKTLRDVMSIWFECFLRYLTIHITNQTTLVSINST